MPCPQWRSSRHTANDTAKLDIQPHNLVHCCLLLNVMGTYAIVETGGKQYKVAAGQKVDVERLNIAEGEDVELSRVLLVANGEDTIVGTPTIDGAKVTATCLGEGKGKKIIVFKYKPKVRYRVKTGHRQRYTRLEIKEIVKPGGEVVKKPEKKKAAVRGEG